MTALAQAEPLAPAQLALLELFEDEWPLECWVSSCARPRVTETLCALHAPQERKPA